MSRRQIVVTMLLLFPATVVAGTPHAVAGSLLIKLRADAVMSSPAAPLPSALHALNNILARTGAGPLQPVWKEEFTRTLAGRMSAQSSGGAQTTDAATVIAERLSADVRRIYRIRYTSPLAPEVVAAELSRIPEVEYAEPEPVYELLRSTGRTAPESIPNDPLYGQYLSYLNFPAAWDTTTGDSTIAIGIVDTGVEYTHPDLAAKLWTNAGETGLDAQGRDKRTNGIDDDGNGFVDDWRGWNFDANSNDPMPTTENHGTGTSSMAAGHTNNGIGISGAGYNCRYMAIKGLTVEAVLYAAVNHAAAANCSFGGGEYSRAMNDVVEFATDAGTLVVCAAGNSNDDIPLYPAAYPSALSVGSVDYPGNGTPNVKSSFSSYGYAVDVMATGNSINGCNFDGYFTGGSGTSFSAPIVAGLAGLLKSVHPDWGARRISAQIRASAVAIDGANPPFLTGKLGHGRIDAFGALTRRLPGISVRSLTYSPASGVVTAHLVNYGYPTANMQCSFSASAGIQILTSATVQTGVIGTDVSVDVSCTIALSKNLDYAPLPVIRLDMTDPGTGFSDFTYLEFFAWAEQSSFSQLAISNISAVDKQTAWAIASGGTFLRTTDGGLTWNTGTIPAHGADVSCIAGVTARTALVAEGSGTSQAVIQRTTDGGTGWSTVFTAPFGSYCTGLRFCDPVHGAALFALPGVDSSLFVVTTNAGVSWRASSAPAASGWSRYLMPNSLTLLDSAHAWFSGVDGGRVARTQDGGVHWSVSSTGNSGPVHTAFVSSASGIAVSAGNEPFVSRTYDGGQHWTSVSGFSAPGIFALAAVPGTTQMWAAQYADWMSVSSDGGLTWDQERMPPMAPAADLDAVKDGDSCYVWGVSYDGNIFHRSVAAVRTAIPAFISFDTRTLDLGNISRALARRDTTLVAVNTGGASDSITVTLDNINIPTDSAVTVSPQSFSLDPGESRPIIFTIFPRFLQTNVVYYSAIVLTTTHAAGPNPLIKSIVFGATGVPSGVDDSPVFPVTTCLDQNYPNPFNPSTTIRYTLGSGGSGLGSGKAVPGVVNSPSAIVNREAGSGVAGLASALGSTNSAFTYQNSEIRIPGASWVRLCVYDMLGREVAVLVDEAMTPGSYSVRFDASHIASGVYMYRLEAGDVTYVKHMILLR